MAKIDDKQSEVIRFRGGRGIVLAAPGCGKTHILALRILMAHQEYKIPYSDMLCVTFTNRASREMKDRIRKIVGDEALSELFVGNMHRFCIRFIYDNELVPIDTCIIDDFDQEEIMQEIVDDNSPERQMYFKVTATLIKSICDKACSKYMTANNFPEEINTFKDTRYIDPMVSAYANAYLEYKRDNKLIDFDDVLLLTYKALMGSDRRRYKYSSYPWIQVDEVQDMNPLQLAICDKLLADNYDSLLYLGDEQQSIYSFLGTNSEGLNALKTKAGKNVFNLPVNYRSPQYLLDMLNDYAIDVLKFDGKFLPTSNDTARPSEAGLVLVKCSDSIKSEARQINVISLLVKTIRNNAWRPQHSPGSNPVKESIGILVRTNKDAEEISKALDEVGVQHMKITKKDIFKGIDFKTLHSHFCVTSNDTRLKDWIQVFHKFKITDTKVFASKYIKEMREIGLTPLDLIEHENSSYCIEFCNSFKNTTVH